MVAPGTLDRIKISETLYAPSADSLAAGLTRYIIWSNVLGGDGNLRTDETQRNTRKYATAPGYLKNFMCHLDTASGAGESAVFTIRINGADTALTVTISGASDTSGSDTTNVVNVSVGDYITVEVVSSGGFAGSFVMAQIEFVKLVQ